MIYQLILDVVINYVCYNAKKREKSYYSARFIDEFRFLLSNDIFYDAKEKFQTKYLNTKKAFYRMNNDFFPCSR